MAIALVINDKVEIPLSELVYTASRSSGPGGQHVNTSDTRIQLRWNVKESVALDDAEQALVLKVLASRLTEAGDLILASDSHRSQRRNREDVTQRLATMVREALIPPKPRKKTKPSRASREKRLDEKRKKARTKKDRGKKFDGAD
ncbi:MAG: aminoacyl-tRNA hydrolase [Candidatus Krumholzibacteria bacterium]|nr:aminoacyl-tRNA hydrolase [Candidatus Krumholzibacteria bacterium]